MDHTAPFVPGGPPVVDQSVKGRLRGFIWRLVGPSLEAQRQFNASLVDHVNRNAAVQQQAHEALGRLAGLVQEHVDGQVRLQAHLIKLLQAITLYVDTKDRASAAGQDVLNAALSAVTDTWMKRWESLTAREERLLHRLSSIDRVGSVPPVETVPLHAEVRR